MDRCILHCDLNSFYASAEMLINPELRGKAVAVCGNPEIRHGIVLAKNDKAKKCGITTGDPVWMALQKCPDLQVVQPHYGIYSKLSKDVKKIYTDFTPNVESFGLDECWLDVSGCEKLYGSPLEIAQKISKRIKEEIGLTISIGVSFNKVFAKLGSDMKKPDAITVIDKNNFKQLVFPLKVQEMLYIGSATTKKLNSYNVVTIGDLATVSETFLAAKFGKAGTKLHQFANGIDSDNVSSYVDYIMPKSVGNGVTTPQDIANLDQAASVIYSLCEVIGFRLRRYDLKGKNISVSYRDTNLITKDKRGQLPACSNNSSLIAQKAILLLRDNYNFSTPLRTITVGVSGFDSGANLQESFFADETSKLDKLDKVIDNLREKYGYSVLKRGINLGTIFVCDSREIDDDFVSFHS